MKNVFKLILASVALSFLSCSGGEDDSSQYLTFELGSKSGILIPAPATTSSCEQIAKGDLSKGVVSGAYFSLGNPTFRWILKEDPALSEILIIALKLSLKSPRIGGDYSCIFADASLGSLYYKTESTGTIITYDIWNGLLGRTETATLNSTADLIATEGFSGCSLKCGGISIPENSGKFSVTGTWEVLAVRKKYKSKDSDEFEEIPIKVQGDFQVENLLN
jgi:hypothetical protein